MRTVPLLMTVCFFAMVESAIGTNALTLADPAMMPIADWLNALKPGYGERFCAVFDEAGYGDASDLDGLPHDERAELLEALAAAGAKKPQLRRLRNGLGVFGRLPGATIELTRRQAKSCLPRLEGLGKVTALLTLLSRPDQLSKLVGQGKDLHGPPWSPRV